MRRTAPTFAALALVAALFALSVELQAARTTAYPPARTTDQFLYIPSGAVMRRLTLSFNALAADVYWIRALQHYGGTKLDDRSDKRYPLLYPLLDITTSLDPRFNLAYRFGAIFLAEPYPNGPGRWDLAITLLQKGLKTQPDKWEYMQDIGFVYYWWRHDYVTAARWFERAANVPAAPWFLRSLAATTLSLGGKEQASRVLWEQIYQSTDNDWVRKDAAWRLQQLTAIDQITRLQAIVDRANTQLGGPVSSWSDLVHAHILPGIPVDPSGTPYQLDPDKAEVELSQRSSLWPLPAQSAMPAPETGAGSREPGARSPESH